MGEEAATQRNNSARSVVGDAGNPTFYESSSGDQNLFFDAKEGMLAMLLSPLGATTSKSQFNYSSASHALTPYKDGIVSDKISSAILDALKGKNQEK